MLKRIRFLLILVLANVLAAASATGQTPQQFALDRYASSLLEKDFIAFDPHYKEEREARVAHTKELAKQMFAEEAKSAKNTCGHQILFELESLLLSSADFKFIDARLHDLEASIGHSLSDKPDNDGMWGSCYQEWYLKLYATYDHLEANDDEHPHIRCRLS